MDKKEEFREFARQNSHLSTYVKDGSMTWQKFYELYDIYGSDHEVWNDYPKKSEKNNSIQDIIKSIDVDKLEGQLQNVSKTLDLIAELTKKDMSSGVTKVVDPRPITNLFKD